MPRYCLHLSLLAALATTLAGSLPVSAQTLRVDIGRDGQAALLSGWSEWNLDPDGDLGAMNVTANFPYSEATAAGSVNITMTSGGSTFVRNYPAVTGDFAGLSDLLRDLAFFNNPLGGSNFLQVQIDNLKAGSYTFTAYHHITNAINGGSPGMDILLNGVDTGDDATTQQGNPGVTAPTTLTTSTVNITVASDNDPVVIRYANPVGGINFGLNGFELAAAGPDLNHPTVVALSPDHGAGGSPVTTNLVMSFSEAVQKGSGTIMIRETIGNGVKETIDVGSAAVSVNGPALTINPTADLEFETGYYVEVAPGAVEDLSGNPFAGLSGNAAWNFTTGAMASDFLAYHDVAGGDHNPPPNTSWQTTANATTDLVRFADGNDTGIDLTTSGVDSLDVRFSGETQAPDVNTPAGFLFLASGLDLNDGTLVKQGGTMTFTFTGLDPAVPYDLALYGDRSATADGVETFTLGGVDSAINLSSGVNSGLSTDWDTRGNGGSGNPGHLARWTSIDPGPDGGMEVTITNTGLNLAYISGVRIGPAVPDTTTPGIVMLSPINGASQAPPAADLVITFGEPVGPGNGSVTIRKTGDDSVVESFDVATSLRLAFTYASITILPTAALAPGTGYYVEIDAGAVEDLAGNPFAGFSGGATWSFTTGTPPDASLTGVPLPGGISPSPAFDNWIAQFAGAGTHIGPYHNPDHSRLNSFGEFAFDGDPLSRSDDGTIAGELNTVGGQQVLTLTVPVRDGAVFSGSPVLLSDLIDGVSYGIQATRDLQLWDVAVSEVTGPDAAAIQAPLPVLSPGWSYRTFRVPGTVADEERVFFRAFADDVPTRIVQARDSAVIASYSLGKVKRWLHEVALPKINSNDLYVAWTAGSARYSSLWNYDDTAADCYPFLFWAAYYTDIAQINTTDGPVHDVLVAEQLHCNLNSTPGQPFGRVPTAVNPDTLVKEIKSYGDTMFAASEYVKDGLIPILEVLGKDNPWFDRMQGIIDDMWANAQVSTAYGLVPTTGTEADGEQLQALARLYTMTGDPKYLDWGERLADRYLLSGTFVPSSLRDHGSEIIGGLGLFYAVESVHRPAKAAAYLAGLQYMLDEILEHGTNADGLMYNSVGGGGLSDGWGYNYPAFLCHDMVVDPPHYSVGLQQTLRNLGKPVYANPGWGSSIDENADSIEGGLYLLNRLPVPEGFAWADQEMAAHVTRTQNPDVNTTSLWTTYKLESNGVRTVLQHALMHTRGLIARPWELDLELGASQTANGVVVKMASASGWTGVLQVDKPRHQLYMGFTRDWPRMNTMPEWFVAEPDETYVVEDLNSGATTTYTGAQLHVGLPVTLAPGVETLLLIRR